jgi:hypothetical protein
MSQIEMPQRGNRGQWSGARGVDGSADWSEGGSGPRRTSRRSKVPSIRIAGGLRDGAGVGRG